MSRYLEHPSRAGRWRAGALEVLPDAAAADLTVWFAVAPGDAEDHEDAVWEGLLARPAEPPVARDVARFLAAAERDGTLQYETGRTDGNPI